jgi:hypothetical protein
MQAQFVKNMLDKAKVIYKFWHYLLYRSIIYEVAARTAQTHACSRLTIINITLNLGLLSFFEITSKTRCLKGTALAADFDSLIDLFN